MNNIHTSCEVAMCIPLNRKNRFSVQNSIFYLLTLSAAYFLKRHYNIATADDLVWILQPTAGAVQWMTGIEFFMERGTGFVNHSVMVIIAKSCAGVNFLIISLCMSVYEVLPNLHDLKSKLMAMIIISAGVFCITVFINAIRITVAIYLLTENVHFGWLTPDRLHRLEGIVIYFLSLWLIFILIQKMMEYMKGNSQQEGTGYA